MKIAHLILVHKNPEQLQRAIHAMDHPAFDFYVHIDRKVDIRQFQALLHKKNVFFIHNRAKVYWGSYGVIQATINGFNEIIPKGYDYINVMSGQDFPIKPTTFIYNYIRERAGTEFITCQSIDREWKEARPRVDNYYLVNWRFPGKYRLENIANAILPKRKFPLDFEIVGKECWFTITTQAASYIVDFIKEHPEVVQFFKYSWVADELMMPTILYNSAFREKIQNNLVYIDWSVCVDGHPRTLTMQDAEALRQTEKLFARKFDINVDKNIVAYLENSIKDEANSSLHIG